MYPDGKSGLKVNAGGRINLSANVLKSGNTDGGLLKAGTSASPVSCGTVASMKFDSRYVKSLAVSGEAVALYNRLYVAGAGGEGIALRSFCTVSDVAATNARGAHISLSFGSSGTVSGLGAALEATLHIPNDGSQAGTLCAIKAAIHSDGSSSDPAGAQVSFFRVDNQGDATGAADVDTDAYLFDLQGFTPGAGSMVDSTSLAELPANSIALKIRVGASVYYLPAVIAAQLN